MTGPAQSLPATAASAIALLALVFSPVGIALYRDYRRAR